jgi:acyl-CoA thioester hydrolase
MPDVFEHPIEVRFRDCDALRHVNHAVYFSYCEQTRFAFWRHLTGTANLNEIRFIVARVECDYLAPATLGDELVVRLHASAIGRASFTLDYEICDPGGTRIFARARTVLVFYDHGTGKSARIPDDVREMLERYLDRQQHPGRRR